MSAGSESGSMDVQRMVDFYRAARRTESQAKALATELESLVLSNEGQLDDGLQLGASPNSTAVAELIDGIESVIVRLRALGESCDYVATYLTGVSSEAMTLRAGVSANEINAIVGKVALVLTKARSIIEQTLETASRMHQEQRQLFLVAERERVRLEREARIAALRDETEVPEYGRPRPTVFEPNRETLENGGRARPPEDSDDFEQVCAEFMRSAGFSDAMKTPMGPDGGVDVVCQHAVGQAKFHGSQKVTGESIRALHGSRDQLGRDRVAMFFAYGPGYTDDAVKAARDLKVYLYKYNAREGRFDRIR